MLLAREISMANGIERMQRMYVGDSSSGIPIVLFYGTEYMCLHTGVPDYKFLFGDHKYRAQVQVNIAGRHDADSLYIWNRGKRRDWLNDYRLTEEGSEDYIWDVKEQRKLSLSRDGYAILYPDKLPYRCPFVIYGESEELVNGVNMFGKPKLEIHTQEDVDRLLPFEPFGQIKAGGMFEGVRLIVEAIGKEKFLEVGCNSSFRMALGYIGLEEGLIFMRQHPEVFRYLVERTTSQELEYLKVMASFGVHGAWINDIWEDLISPDDYCKFVMPSAITFIEECKRLGIKSHYYPCGRLSLQPYVRYVNEMKPDAFHLEEYSNIDIADLRRKLDKDILLYGNLAAYEVLQEGPISAIQKEVRRQINVCLNEGPFVMALGSEVTKNTSPEYVDAMIEAAHFQR